MTPTTKLEKVDHKLRRLRAIESSYRKTIKRAQEELRNETVDKEKAQKRYDKVKKKYNRKIEKLQPKIRALMHKRAELKG